MSGDGYLVVCATPLGNLGDASSRLAETLSSVDIIFAEDTRRTAKLLAHLGVDTPMRSLFVGNEAARADDLVEEVVSGRKVALVSDAGMPTISDPGAATVAAVRKAGGRVTALPGPSAVTMSMALSGMPGDRFVFEGFLPKKGRDRAERIASIGRESRPVVLFVSPHRLTSDLVDLVETLGGERRITLNRELTKLHEEVWEGSLAEAVDEWTEDRARGEITIVVAPTGDRTSSFADAVAGAAELVAQGVSVSQAAREMAELSGLSRRELYQALLEDQERS